MTTINLHQPGKLDIEIPFPTEWNELLLQELHAIGKHMLTDFQTPAAGRVAILKDLLLIRSKHHKVKLPAGFFQNLDAEDAVLNGFPLLDFIYQENNRTEQPYCRLKIFGPALLSYTTVYGPSSGFDNMTCGEFEDAEIFYYQFGENPSGEALAHLASILFRPKGKPYIRFDQKTGRHITYNAEKMYPFFLKLQPWVLYTIFIWYCGCRNQLPKYFPTPFEKDGSEDEREGPDFLAFTKCIHSGAGPKNGSRDEIRATLLKEFFLEMELEAQKAKDLNKKS